MLGLSNAGALSMLPILSAGSDGDLIIDALLSGNGIARCAARPVAGLIEQANAHLCAGCRRRYPVRPAGANGRHARRGAISAAHMVTFIALKLVPADRQSAHAAGILHYDALGIRKAGWQARRRSGV